MNEQSNQYLDSCMDYKQDLMLQLDHIVDKNARSETYYDPQFVQTKKIQFKVLPPH